MARLVTYPRVFSTILLVASLCQCEELTFSAHEINASSAFSSCAALDVNRDGKLDIVAGGYWYEAPTWKKRLVREVEMIRGRYDDYSNLPLDVNGDGWTDLVSCNYRSQSLYWVEHPGKSLGEWTKHVIDTPGAVETGRLVDVDGDGQLDVLPNGVKFAAWWELVRENVDGKTLPKWIRHDLPNVAAGHGVGFGDVNGDGRGDIVSPNGWLEAPEDRRADRWEWHADFRLHRDCSVPILVHDVDADRDNDLIWGRGHKTGLYWLEQVRDDRGQITWTRHVIDTSWSQSHSLMLADIDNDKRLDLIAGKRYMGHDGKDLGEYDPLVIYWYKFDPKLRSWKRSEVASPGVAGFDLDPKAVDIDADGDVDILAPARNGLFLYENELVSKTNASKKQSVADQPRYDNHEELLVYKSRDGNLNEVKSAEDWAKRRSHILRGMEEVMGPIPDSSRRVPLDVKVVEEEETDKYIRRRITYAAEPGDRVPAYLLIPKRISGRAPAMLCLHPTSALGKSQICGLGGKPSRFYAHELAERGYVCIAPDYQSFGEYDKYDFSADDYVSGTMKAIWNNIRAVDVLEAMPEVDAERIGAIGHSLGGHNALFTAPFDLRIKAVVTSCGFTAFHHYYEGNLKGWTSDRYMPRIRDVYKNDPDKMPFDFYEVLAAIAPRPIFVNAPLHDSNFEVNGVSKAVAGANDVYDLLGAPKELQAVYPDCGHDFPEDIRYKVYNWLGRVGLRR